MVFTHQKYFTLALASWRALVSIPVVINGQTGTCKSRSDSCYRKSQKLFSMVKVAKKHEGVSIHHNILWPFYSFSVFWIVINVCLCLVHITLIIGIEAGPRSPIGWAPDS